MRLRRLIHFWHRRLGVTVALFAIILSVTGIALNHAAFLRLNEIQIEAEWLLSWYGVQGVTDDAVAFRVGENWVSSTNGRVFLDARPIAQGDSQIVGAVSSGMLLVVVSPRDIGLFTPEGDLVEHFFPSHIEDDITRVGLAAGIPIVRAGEGLFQADESAAIWSPFEGQVAWSVPAPVPDNIASVLNQHLRGEGLPLYRILLDVHSGRFFTGAGRYVMDGASLLLIVLSVTGVWMWWPRRGSRR